MVPQGFLAAGDGYTQRFDEIVARFQQHRKLVDDSALWGQTIEETFRLTCDFLTTCSGGGVVFGEKKFQFCKREVEYVGFMVGDKGIRPTGKMLETIADFPRPRDLSGVRSFFGLVE